MGQLFVCAKGENRCVWESPWAGMPLAERKRREAAILGKKTRRTGCLFPWARVFGGGVFRGFLVRCACFYCVFRCFLRFCAVFRAEYVVFCLSPGFVWRVFPRVHFWVESRFCQGKPDARKPKQVPQQHREWQAKGRYEGLTFA